METIADVAVKTSRARTSGNFIMRINQLCLSFNFRTAFVFVVQLKFETIPVLSVIKKSAQDTNATLQRVRNVRARSDQSFWQL